MALTQTPEEGLKVSNAPSDGKFLQYKDSADKLTWADATSVGGANGVDFNDDVNVQFGTNYDGHIRYYNSGLNSWTGGQAGAQWVFATLSTGTDTTPIRFYTKSVVSGSAVYSQYAVMSPTNKDVALFYNGNQKFITTNTGIGVTGEVSSVGATDLTLNTNAGTNSGSIVITDAADGDITLTPNGTGDVVIDGLKYPQADGSAGQFLKTDGSAQLSWATVSSTPEGEAIQSTTNSNEASTKFLRADGDGTCSWQIPPAATTTSGTDNFTVADGNLVIGTAGHGIDFSAGANNAGTTSELLDDYEEGVFTVTSGTTNQTFHSNSDLLAYVKIGSFVYFGGQLRVDDAGDSTHVQLHINNLPFQNNGGGEGSADNRCAFSFGGMTKDEYNGGAGYYDTTWWRNITIGGTTLLNYRSIDTNNRWFYGYVIDDAYVTVTGSYRTND